MTGRGHPLSGAPASVVREIDHELSRLHLRLERAPGSSVAGAHARKARGSKYAFRFAANGR